MLLCKTLRELYELVLQLFLRTCPKSETITHLTGKEEKKLSQRIIKIWVFWDVILCHWVSDAYFNGRFKTTNSVMQYHIPRIIILPVVLHRCETWSLTLREEHRLRVFDNRVLRRIFGPQRDEVMGEWRKLHNEELNGL
jgi:Zn-finger domain-containing protein